MAWVDIPDPTVEPTPTPTPVSPAPVPPPVAEAAPAAPVAPPTPATSTESALPASSIPPAVLTGAGAGTPPPEMAPAKPKWVDIPNPFEEPKETVGLPAVIAESLRSGVAGATTDLPGLPFTPEQEAAAKPSAEVQKLLDEPIKTGWYKPEWLAANLIHPFAGSYPSLALGAAGGALGEEYGPGGALLGSAAGFGFGSALQAVRPAYAKAIAEGLSPQDATRRAMKETGIATIFGTAMGLAPGAHLFGKTIEGALERPLMEALVQITGVQPALAVGQSAATQLSEGKGLPTAEEAAKTAFQATATGVALTAAHGGAEAAHNLIAGEPGAQRVTTFEGAPIKIGDHELTPEQAAELRASGVVPTEHEASIIREMNRIVGEQLPHGVNRLNVYRNDAGDIVVPRTGGGIPFDKPTNLYSWGSEHGLGGDKVMLAKAQDATAAGQSPLDIWNNFGWYLDPQDGEWLRYIDDSKIKIKPGIDEHFQAMVKDWGAKVLYDGRLGDFMDHSELFGDTPASADTNLVVLRPSPRSSILGWFDEKKNRMVVQAPDFNPKSSVKTAIHEIDHFMQSEDGRTGGSSSARPPALNWLALYDLRKAIEHIDATGENKELRPWLVEQQAAIKEALRQFKETPEMAQGAYRANKGENNAEAAVAALSAEEHIPGAGKAFPETFMETSPRETIGRHHPIVIVPDESQVPRRAAFKEAVHEVTGGQPFRAGAHGAEKAPLTHGLHLDLTTEGLVRETERLGGHRLSRIITESIHQAQEKTAQHEATAHALQHDADVYAEKLHVSDPERAKRSEALADRMIKSDKRMLAADAALTALEKEEVAAGRGAEDYANKVWDIIDGSKTFNEVAGKRPTVRRLLKEYIDAYDERQNLHHERATDESIDPGYVLALENAEKGHGLLSAHRNDIHNLHTAKDIVDRAIVHGGDAVAFKGGPKFKEVHGIPKAKVEAGDEASMARIDRLEAIARTAGRELARRSEELTGVRMNTIEAEAFLRYHVADPFNEEKTKEELAVAAAFPKEVAEMRDILETEEYIKRRDTWSSQEGMQHAPQVRPYDIGGRVHAASEAQPGGGEAVSKGFSPARRTLEQIRRAGESRRGIAGTETFGVPGFTGVVTSDKPAADRTDRRIYRVYPEGLKFNRLQPPLKQHGQPLGYVKISRHLDGRWQVDDVDTSRTPGLGLAQKLYDAIERHMGVKIEPSGYLTKEGYERLWMKRDPEAVRDHQWSEYHGHYLSPLQVKNALDLVNEHLATPGLDLRGEWARGLITERDSLQRMWDNLSPDVQERATPDKMFSLAPEEPEYRLLLPHEAEWGNPRFNEDDKAKALERLDEIARLDVRSAPWADVVKAREDIAKIVDEVLYYHPSATAERIRENPNGDLWAYMRVKSDPKFLEGPDGQPLRRPPVFMDPEISPEIKDIVDAGRLATEHMLSARRAGVDPLFRHGTTTEPRRGGKTLEPGNVGETLPSGFYFKAARALADVPDALFKMKGQSVIDHLQQAGVKRAEIKHLELDQFANRKATREEFQQQIADRMFDFKRKLLELNPERSNKDYELGGTRAFRGPRIPGRGTYFERLMAFPKKLFGGAPFAPGQFVSPHWQEIHPGAWASWRGSVREVPGWGKVVVGEEGQTDYMQGAHGEKPRRPRVSSPEYMALLAERKKYEKAHADVHDKVAIALRTADLNYPERQGIRDMFAGSNGSRMLPLGEWNEKLEALKERIRQEAPQPNAAKWAIQELDRAAAIRAKNDKYFQPDSRRKYSMTETSFTPETPIDENYVKTMVRDLLIHAAKQEADSVAISTSDTTGRIQINTFRSAAHFYDRQLRPVLQRELRRITGDDSLTLQKVNLPKAMGGPKREKPYSVWMAPLTAEARVRILGEGLPLFSLAHEPEPTAQAKTRLAALHNLTEENVAFAEKMGGGIAVPSIGVVKEGMGVGGFGDITLIGRRDIADPEHNPVFDADAYTARFPRPDYKKAKVKPTQELIDKLRGDAKKFDERGPLEVVWDSAINRANPSQAISHMTRYNFAKSYFLREVLGKPVEPVYREAITPRSQGALITFPAFAKVVEKYKGKEFDWGEYGSKEHKAVTKAFIASIKEAVKDLPANYKAKDKNTLAQVYMERYLDSDGLLSYGSQGWIGRAMKDIGHKAVDAVASTEAIDAAMQGHEAAFKKWVDDTILPLYGEPRIKVNGKLVPYTLGNIVEAMSSANVKGKEKTLAFGEGQVRAQAAYRFPDLETMRRRAETAIQDPETVAAARAKTSKALEDWRNAVLPFDRYKDTWAGMDRAMRALGKVAAGRSVTEGALSRALAAEDFRGVPQSVLADGVAAARMLLDAPVPYFESKPQRVVRLGDFAGAVVPSGTSPETIAALQGHGLTVRVYDRGNGEAERQQTAAAQLARDLAESEGTLFSLKGFYSPAGRAIEQFPQNVATVAQWKALLTPGKIPGVTRNWVDYLHLDDVLPRLADANGKISKDDLTAYIKTADVNLDDVTFRGPDAEWGDTEESNEQKRDNLRNELDATYSIEPTTDHSLTALVVDEDQFFNTLAKSRVPRAILKEKGYLDENNTYGDMYPTLEELDNMGIHVSYADSKALEQVGGDTSGMLVVHTEPDDSALVFRTDEYGDTKATRHGSYYDAEYYAMNQHNRAVEDITERTYPDTGEGDEPGVSTKFHEYNIPGARYIAEILVKAEHIAGHESSKHFRTNEILHLRLGEIDTEGGKALVWIEGQSDLDAKGQVRGYETPQEREAALKAYHDARRAREDALATPQELVYARGRTVAEVQASMMAEARSKNGHIYSDSLRLYLRDFSRYLQDEIKGGNHKVDPREAVKHVSSSYDDEGNKRAAEVLSSIPETTRVALVRALVGQEKATRALEEAHKKHPPIEHPIEKAIDFPHKGGAWLELGAKLVLRFAVEHGYGSVVLPKARMIGDAVGASRIHSFGWSREGNDFTLLPLDKDGNPFIDEVTGETQKTILKGDPDGGHQAAVGWIAKKFGANAAEQFRYDLTQGKLAGTGRTEDLRQIYDARDMGDVTAEHMPEGGAANLGMQLQYEEKMPAFFQKYTAKWGGKVTEEPFEDFADTSLTGRLKAALALAQRSIAGSEPDRMKAAADSIQEALDKVRTLGEDSRLYHNLTPDAKQVFNAVYGDTPNLKVLHINDAIRGAIMAGQPLYALKGFYSAGRKAVENFQASASVEQWKALLKPGKVPGITANWLAMTDLEGFLGGFRPGQKVSRADVISYIDATEQPVDERWHGDLEEGSRAMPSEDDLRRMAEESVNDRIEEDIRNDSLVTTKNLNGNPNGRKEFDAIARELDPDGLAALIGFMRDEALGPDYAEPMQPMTQEAMLDRAMAKLGDWMDEKPAVDLTLAQRAQEVHDEALTMMHQHDTRDLLDRFDAIAKEFGREPFSASTAEAERTYREWNGDGLIIKGPDKFFVLTDRSDEPFTFDDAREVKEHIEELAWDAADRFYSDDYREGLIEDEMRYLTSDYQEEGGGAQTEYHDYNIPGVQYRAEIEITLPDLDWGGWSPPHFDSPNLLFMQLGEVRLPDGENAIIPVAIQSDAHQTGMKKGYATPEGIADWQDRMNKYEEDYAEYRRQRTKVDMLSIDSENIRSNTNEAQFRMIGKLNTWIRENPDAGLDTGDVSWYVLYSEAPVEAQRAMDQIDPEYGPKLERWQNERTALQTRIHELNVALGHGPEYPGEKPKIPGDLPFKGDAAIELGVRKLIQLAVEHGYPAIVLPTALQAAHAAGARRVTSLGWRTTPEGIEISPKQSGQTDSDKPRVFRYGAGGDMGPALAQIAKRTTGAVARKIKADIAEGKADGEIEGLKVVNFGMQRQYDDAIPNYASKLVKKLGGEVSRKKVGGLPGEEPVVGESPFALRPGLTGQDVAEFLYNAANEFLKYPEFEHAVGTMERTAGRFEGADAAETERALARLGSEDFYGALTKGLTLQDGTVLETPLMANPYAGNGNGGNMVLHITPKLRAAVEGGQPLYNADTAPRPDFTQNAPQRQVVQGYWSTNQRSMGIALSHGNPIETTFEEIAHALGPHGLNLISNKERATLRRAAIDENWAEQYIPNIAQYRAAYRGRPNLEDMIIEEAIAHKYADYAVRRNRGDVSSEVSGVFDGVRSYFNRMRRALNGQNMYTVGDVFGKMYSGDVGRRGKPMPPIRFFDLLPPAMAGVTGAAGARMFDDLIPAEENLIAFHDLVPAGHAGAMISFDDLIPQSAASM